MEKKTKVLVASAILVSIPLLMIAALYASTYYYSGKSLPTQSYLGKSISGLSYNDLKAKLSLANNSLSQSSVQINHKDEQAILFAEQVILDIDSSKNLKEIKFYKGRPTLVQLWNDILLKEVHTPEVSINPDSITDSLSKNLSNLTPTLNASISPEGSIQAEQNGLSIDFDDFQTQFESQLKSPRNLAIDLSTKETTATVSQEDIQFIESNIVSVKDESFILTVLDKEFQLSVFDNLDQIKFDKIEDNLEVSFSEKFITNYLNEIVRPQVKEEPGKLELIYNSDSGKVDFESDSKKGIDLNIEGSIDSINESLESKLFNATSSNTVLSTISLDPTLEIDPVLKEKGVTELVETGYTTFRGSTYNRIKNINVGMDRFNGLMIEPGEEFSFNENLGPVDASAGYVPELVIKSIGTIPEYGGGLCQVSSTLYRAALMSGLEITERDNHSYAVGYYAQVLGHGLDATIYPGVKDLKITNNSGNTIVMQAYAEGTSAYFKIYGTKHIDRVELVGPINTGYRSPGAASITVNPNLPAGTVKVMDNPVTGFNSYWERIIYDKDNNKKVEEIFSDYRAINQKLIVSPDYYGDETQVETQELEA